MTFRQITTIAEIPSLDFSFEEFLNESYLNLVCPALTLPEEPFVNSVVIEEEDDTKLNSNFCLVLNDLLAEGPRDALLPPPPYQENDLYLKKAQETYRQLLGCVLLKERIPTLIYSYYLGQLLRDPTKERKRAEQSMTYHYIRSSKRMYRLYKRCPEQILNTKRTMLSHVKNLSREEMDILVPKQ